MGLFTANETENIVKTWAVIAPELEKYGKGLFIKYVDRAFDLQYFSEILVMYMPTYFIT